MEKDSFDYEIEKIIIFIKEQLIRIPSIEINQSTSLMKSGLINSMSSVDLALFLEETYNVNIPDYAINPKNMDSVELIVAYIATLKQN